MNKQMIAGKDEMPDIQCKHWIVNLKTEVRLAV